MEKVVNYIESKGYIADYTEIEKNGEMRKCICIRDTDSIVATVYYLDSEGISITHVEDFMVPFFGDKIIKYHKNHISRSPNVDKDWSNWNEVKDKIILCARKTPDIDTGLYSYNYNDMQIYLRIIVDCNNSEVATAGVSNDLFELWEASPKTIVSAAMKNTMGHLKILGMGEAIGEPLLDDINPIKMKIITSDFQCYGGSGIFIKEFMNKVLDEMEVSRVCVIPSSVHETIIIPFENEVLEISELKSIVAAINPTIEAAERLSDDVYIWENDTLLIAEEGV